MTTPTTTRKPRTPKQTPATPPPAPKETAKDKTASDYRRELDAAIIVKAGELVAEVPAKLRAEVAQLIANQLHHLSTPKAGWPGSLPKPARSEWK